MVWHEHVTVEIEVEFLRLMPVMCSHIEDTLYVALKYRDREWAKHGEWWRKTTAGKRYQRKASRERTTRLRGVVVAVRGCATCGKPFEVTADRAARKRALVCSPQCRGAKRKNIKRIELDGVSKTLTQWAIERGLGMSTVWARLKRGWTFERALAAPLRGCSTRKRPVKLHAPSV